MTERPLWPSWAVKSGAATRCNSATWVSHPETTPAHMCCTLLASRPRRLELCKRTGCVLTTGGLQRLRRCFKATSLSVRFHAHVAVAQHPRLAMKLKPCPCRRCRSLVSQVHASQWCANRALGSQLYPTMPSRCCSARQVQCRPPRSTASEGRLDASHLQQMSDAAQIP